MPSILLKNTQIFLLPVSTLLTGLIMNDLNGSSFDEMNLYIIKKDLMWRNKATKRRWNLPTLN